MWLFFSSFARQRNVNWLYVTRYIGGWGNIGNLSHSPPRVPSTLHGDLMGGKPGLNVLEQQQRQSTFKLGHHFSKVAKSLWLRFSDTKRHNHLRHFSKSTTASCRNRPCRYIQLMATVQSSSALCPTSPRNCVFGNELGYREVCSTLASWWSGISWIKFIMMLMKMAAQERLSQLKGRPSEWCRTCQGSYRRWGSPWLILLGRLSFMHSWESLRLLFLAARTIYQAGSRKVF